MGNAGAPGRSDSLVSLWPEWAAHAPGGISLKPAQTKINNLQALRAFAALAVVVFHTGYIVPNLHAVGSFGVDIFFVLSGYIMARICEQSPRFFLRRRLIRIVPPYWTLTILLFLAALKLPALMGNTSPSPVELLKSLFFIPFYKGGSGLIRPLLFVGWSLNYEMLFYLVLWLSLTFLPRRPLLVSSAAIVALHYGAELTHSRSALTVFLSQSFILEFPLGFLAYHLAKHVGSVPAKRWRWVSLSAIASSIFTLILLQLLRPALGATSEGFFYNTLSMVVVLATSLLSQGGWDTRWTPIILLGDASYVLYLVHPYCEYALQRILVPHLPRLTINEPPGCLLAVGASVAAAMLLHRYAELPVLRILNERFGGHRKSAEFRVLAEQKGQVNL